MINYTYLYIFIGKKLIVSKFLFSVEHQEVLLEKNQKGRIN